MPFILGALALIIIAIIVANVRIVPQADAFVIERLGSYYTTWENGLHVKVPIIDRVAKKVSLKEAVVDFPPQPVITKDNVTMQIDTVVFYRIVNPKLYTYGVERPMMAIENLTATTLRNIIGEMELDSTLTSVTLLTQKLLKSLTLQQTLGVLRLTVLSLKTLCRPKKFRIQWKSR